METSDPRAQVPAGPITDRAIAFFDAMPRSNPRARPSARVPLAAPTKLSERITQKIKRPRTDDVLVVRQASQAWLAFGGAVAVCLGTTLVLGLELSDRADALDAATSQTATLTKKLADDDARIASLTALTAANATAAGAALTASPIAQAAVTATKVGATPVAGHALAIEAALVRSLKPELSRGDAKLVVDGASVHLVLNEGALFDGKKNSALTKRGEDVLGRVASALAPVDDRVDVIARDGVGARGAAVEHALGDKVKDARLSLVLTKATSRDRRLEIVTSPL